MMSHTVKICRKCAVEFIPKWRNTKGHYCSKACLMESLNERNRVPRFLRKCEWCPSEFTVGGFGKAKGAQRFCSIKCSQIARFRKYKHPVLGMVRSPRATLSPSSFDIAWAAGIFEGEGSCRFDQASKSVTATISQNGIWLPQRFVDLFGGSITERKERTRFRYSDRHFDWNSSGSRARSFLMTIYQFLSPRRKLQARMALEQWKTT